MQGTKRASVGHGLVRCAGIGKGLLPQVQHLAESWRDGPRVRKYTRLTSATTSPYPMPRASTRYWTA